MSLIMIRQQFFNKTTEERSIFGAISQFKTLIYVFIIVRISKAMKKRDHARPREN